MGIEEDNEKRKKDEETRQVAERYWVEQLGSLPWKAHVAFAVRCLQRTYSFVNKGKDMPKEIVHVTNRLIQAIKEGEEKIGNKVSTEDFRTIESKYTLLFSFDPNYRKYSLLEMYMARASLSVPVYIEKICCSDEKVTFAKSMDEYMAEMFVCIVEMLEYFFGNNIPDFFIDPVKRDLALIKQSAQAENWTDDTPFPAEFFGPLWPEVSTDGFRAEEGINNLQPPQLNGNLIRKLQHPK